MSQQIAEFYAKISAETSGLQAGLESANKKLDALGQRSTSAGKSVGGLQGKLTSMLNPTTLVTAAVTGLAVYLGKATAAAAESAQVDAKLAAVIKATGGVAGLTAGEIDNMSTSLSKMSGVDDEVVKNGAAVLLTFREIGEQVFPQAMEAALNMSAVMGGDLQGSIVQIGKALNDPIAGVSALRKVGVALTDQQKEQIQSYIALGDVESAQAVILQELQMEFGGAAEAMNAAGSGSENLKTAFGNLAEEIGGLLLPGTRSFNEVMTETVDGISANIAANAQWRATLKLIAPELYNQYLLTATITPEMAQLVEQYEASKDAVDGWEAVLKAANAAQNDAVASTMDFNAEMANLNTILSGELMKSQEDYNQTIADYTAKLAEAKSQEEKDEINANIAAETDAYNERAQAIAFNIQQEAILNSSIPDEAKVNMITRLGQSYGMYDEATAKLIVTNQGLIEQVETGNLSWQQAATLMEHSSNGILAVTEAAEEAKRPLDNLSSNVYHVGERAKDTAIGFGEMGEGALGLGEDVSSSATPAVAGLKSVINQLSDKTVNIDVYIKKHGSLPGIASQTAQLDQFDYHNNWAGGPLGSDWTVVGDMPGGVWGPHTELISPSGYVFDAKTSRKMKDAGMLGNVQNMYYGGEGPGIFTPGNSKTDTHTPPPKKPRKPKDPPPKNSPVITLPPGDTSTGGSVDTGGGATPDDTSMSSITAQVVASVQNVITGALSPTQRLAVSASVQNNSLLRELNGSLQQLIAKTPSARDIGRAAYGEGSKFS